MKNISKLPTDQCCGCEACANSCPKSAITMKYDSEGFLFPQIDNDKCINCSICVKSCPVLNIAQLQENQTNKPLAFAAFNKNTDIRIHSSSGGLFTAFAELFLNNGGYVCAAAFDNQSHLRHIITNKQDDLAKLRGSKYVQSEISNCFTKIKKLLDKNTPVLFCGTPCQAAGLKAFLKKDYSQLLILDIICHGVPSPKVFEKYIQDITSDKMTDDIQFRNKENGWRNSAFVIRSKNGVLKTPLAKEPFIQSYMQHLFSRKSCKDCKFAVLPRCSDITIGDFWGIEKCLKEMDDGMGTSAIIINNQKGNDFFLRIKKHIKIKKNDIKNISRGNPNYLGKNTFHINREVFMKNFSKLSNHPLEEIINISSSPDKNVALLNFHWENNNYGAILTAFALNHYIRSLGFNAYNINYILNPNQKSNEKFIEFREQHIPETHRVFSVTEMKELNKYFKHFLVGSDQVWRHDAIHDLRHIFFLDFADNTKNIFSYAASFGEERYCKQNYEKQQIKTSLCRFSNISVRETSGIDIVRNEFGLQAQKVVDPVFLLNEKEWDNIIGKTELPKTTYNVHYLLSETQRNEVEKLYPDYLNLRYDPSVPEWLNTIKNASFIITDSFHGTCFALIFKKQFVCANSNSAVITRLKSLLGELGLNNRLISEINKEQIDKLEKEKIDYKTVDNKLKQQIKISENFIATALNSESPCLTDKGLNLSLDILAAMTAEEKKKCKTKCKIYKWLTLLTFNHKKYKKKYNYYKKLYKSF